MNIILTTTVYTQDKCYLYQKNHEERLENYLKSIKQWINSPFKIIVVENSGYTFPEFQQSDRFEIITFNESTLHEAKYLIGNNSKGASELFSINYSIKNSKILTPGDFIIKVTGRYFIPDFEKCLLNLNLFDAIIQNDRSSCEIIGCSFEQKDLVFNTSDILDGSPCNHIEFLYKKRIELLNKVLILKKLNISPTKMGGANVIRNSL
jgi:hypothetical protein